ncbi:MAG TPA: hypothetical protein VF068_01760 [Rubrobacter sp.]
MKITGLMRWVGPAAIAGGVFMVLSDLSGLPITIPYLSQASPTGYDVVGSGLILFALVLLLVGMVGLYARQSEPRGARVIEYGEGYPRDFIEELPAPEETPHQLVGEESEAVAPRAPRAGALVLGTGLLLFFLLRH